MVELYKATGEHVSLTIHGDGKSFLGPGFLIFLYFGGVFYQELSQSLGPSIPSPSAPLAPYLEPVATLARLGLITILGPRS